jgi:hypothetical protein
MTEGMKPRIQQKTGKSRKNERYYRITGKTAAAERNGCKYRRQ